MKLGVPFYPQTSTTNCGPAALQMILAYFGNPAELSVIEHAARMELGKGLHTIQLALAAARLGFSVQFFTKSLGLNPAYREMDFYKKYSSMTKDRMASFVLEARRAHVVLAEKTFSLGELLSHVQEDSLALVLLDWHVVMGVAEYQGHFVPIAGFDDWNVFVHNPGPKDGRAFVPIERALFDRARKSLGTDEDCIVISKKG